LILGARSWTVLTVGWERRSATPFARITGGGWGVLGPLQGLLIDS